MTMSGCGAFRRNIDSVLIQIVSRAADCRKTKVRVEGLVAGHNGQTSASHHRPPAFPAVDFFWLADAWNPEDPTLTFRTQTLL